MLRFVPCLLILAAASGCTDDRVELLLDVRTDMVPGVEFSLIRTERFDHRPRTEERASPEDTRERRAARGEEWDGSERIAELAGLEPGVHWIRVRMLKQTETPVLQQISQFTVRETSVFTIPMNRDCRGVMCPAGDDPTLIACVGGTCADPRCTEETPEHCPAATCASDAECTAGVSCATGRCAAGVCYAVADEEACAPYEWCSPDDGCVRETAVITGGAGALVDAYGLAVTPDGDVAVAGAVTGSVDFGPGAIAASAERATMVARYGPDLALRWGHVWGGSGPTEARAVAVTDDGLVRTIGYFMRDAMFGAHALSAGSGQDVLYLEHDPSGAVVTATQYPTVRSNGQGRGMDVRADGTIALAGVYGTDLDLAGVALPPVPDALIDWGFVAVVAPDGTPVFAISLPGTGSVLGDVIGLMSDGGVCVAGRFDADVTVGADTLTTHGLNDGFVARLDPSGAPVWSASFGGPMNDFPYALVVDGEECVIAGQMGAGAMFGVVAAESAGVSDGFVVRYGADGEVRFVTTLGGAGEDHVFTATAAFDGEVIVGGAFADAIEIGGTTLTGTGADGLIAGIAPDGSISWARAFGGAGDEEVVGLAFDPGTGRLAMAYRFSGATEVGRFAVTATGGRETLLHWLTP